MKNKELINEYVRILSEKEADKYDVLQALQKRKPGAPMSPKAPLGMQSKVPLSGKSYAPVPTSGSPTSPGVPAPLKAKPLPIAKPGSPMPLPGIQGPTMGTLSGPTIQTKGTGKLSLPQKDIEKTVKNIDPSDIPDASKFAKLIKPPSLNIPNATKYATLLDPEQEDLPDATKYAKLMSPSKPKKSSMPSMSKLSRVSYV